MNLVEDKHGEHTEIIIPFIDSHVFDSTFQHRVASQELIRSSTVSMKFISIKILSLILSASTSKSSNIDLGASELLNNSITITKNKPLALRNL
jgi:hypothetical protein